jgi:hypothetical protein
MAKKKTGNIQGGLKERINRRTEVLTPAQIKKMYGGGGMGIGMGMKVGFKVKKK